MLTRRVCEPSSGGGESSGMCVCLLCALVGRAYGAVLLLVKACEGEAGGQAEKKLLDKVCGSSIAKTRERVSVKV